MKRISAFFYGIACYGMFFATLLYACRGSELAQ
jgi:hypothetical protein